MDKIVLPKKTKIITWIIVVIGGIGLIVGLFGIIFGSRVYEFGMVYALLGIVSFISGLLLFLSGNLLFKRKKWAWKTAIGILSLGVISTLGIIVYLILTSSEYRISDIGDFAIYILLPISPFLLPLILLLLDRKNYWKIAS